MDHSSLLQLFLMLLLDVVQSTLKSHSSGSDRVAVHIICPSLSAGNLFLLCSTVKEKIRGKFIFGLPLGVCLMLMNSCFSVIPTFLSATKSLSPSAGPCLKNTMTLFTALTTLVWPSTNGFLNGDECICSPSEHLKRF